MEKSDIGILARWYFSRRSRKYENFSGINRRKWERFVHKSRIFDEYLHAKKTRPHFSEMHAAAHIFFQKPFLGLCKRGIFQNICEVNFNGVGIF